MTVLLSLHHGVWHWLAHKLGQDDGGGGYYLALSGWVGLLTFLTAFAAWWVHHVCHEPRCVRPGRHPHADGVHRLCSRHHPDVVHPATHGRRRRRGELAASHLALTRPEPPPAPTRRRPYRFDRDRRSLFLEQLRSGQTRTAAARAVAVDRRTVQRAMSDDPDFERDVAAAEVDAARVRHEAARGARGD